MYSSYYNNKLYFLLLAAILISYIINLIVSGIYKKYSNMHSYHGFTGGMAARKILDQNGLYNVAIDVIPGNLTDYYDPRNNKICLGADEYNSTSPVAIGVACHECGHAIQYAERYAPVKIRSAIVNVTNIGSKLSMPLILAGILISGLIPQFWNLVYVGIALFSLSVIFQLITLPVEFDASRRALNAIERTGILTDEERAVARKVLTAAALTYVAALAVSVLQLLRMISIYGRGKRKN